MTALPAVAKTAAELQEIAGGKEIALTPTMGGLHEGHVSLARLAKTLAPVNVVSVYVNPMQFGPGEDFNEYPRSMAADCEKLRGVADVVFAPDTLYPDPQTVRISLPPIAGELCGQFRPGFFEGVSLAVCKLFNMTQPRAAVFGLKDFQQLHIVRVVTKQLGFLIDIVAGPTAREEDGLAMSSRNAYLSVSERERAALLPHVLRAGAEKINAGKEPEAVAKQAAQDLQSGGFAVDYVEARDYETLGAPVADKKIIMLAAATLGRARLIDNIACGAT